MKKHIMLIVAALLMGIVSMAAQENYKTVGDISYTVKTDKYAMERLKLDVYYPEGKTDCPVVVWFHGGGLTAGSKQIPEKIKGKGMVIVGVNYRLLPNVTIDKCLDDCAEAVAWVFKNISRYGGSTKKIFVSGHSAGGYITMMLGMDKQWLAKYGVDANEIAALIPFSGQAISHFAYRTMNGIGNLQPTIDRFAPLYWVRKDCPPMTLITGDREFELFGRYEENALLLRYMKLAGNTTTELYELGGYGHVSMVEPAFHIMLNAINHRLGLKVEP